MKSKLIFAVLLSVTLGMGVWLGQRMDSGKQEAMTQAASAPPASTERKVLYYRNPMGLPDTSPVPKKDSMGMDYVPVYENDREPGGDKQVRISIEKVQKLGVRTEAATLRKFSHTLRTAGKVAADERKMSTIAPRFEGWIDKLYVNTTGQSVTKDQPLLDVYSPELVSAQREYAIAAAGLHSMREADPQAQQGMTKLAEASLARLRNWEISDEQIRQLNASGEVKRTLTFRSPVNGVVMEKKALQGMRFMPGEMLYQIADLSTIWVIADVFEQDLSFVQAGQHANVNINAYPERNFDARVTYIYPTMNAQTRTVPVRLELPNPHGLLKPDMYASVEFVTSRKGKVLSIPISSVIYTGTRQIVLVELAEGRYESREISLGAQGNDYVEVLEGIGEGEKVVVSANFLIDAESNLQAALGGFGGHATHGGKSPATDGAAAEHVGHAETPSAAEHKGH
jgi:Cu(I)/Ag(I) efflux system membrane fusion protein